MTTGAYPTLSILIDSNIFIAIEDHPTVGHINGALASELLSLAQRLNSRIMISDGTRSDLLQASESLRDKRLKQLQKYDVLKPVDRKSVV